MHVQTRCACETQCPLQRPFFFFFKNCDLHIWLWQMTLTLLLKTWFYPKEYICEIWRLYHLPFRSYGQCKSFVDKQTDRPKTVWSPMPRHKNIDPCKPGAVSADLSKSFYYVWIFFLKRPPFYLMSWPEFWQSKSILCMTLTLHHAIQTFNSIFGRVQAKTQTVFCHDRMENI